MRLSADAARRPAHWTVNYRAGSTEDGAAVAEEEEEEGREEEEEEEEVQRAAGTDWHSN